MEEKFLRKISYTRQFPQRGHTCRATASKPLSTPWYDPSVQVAHAQQADPWRWGEFSHSLTPVLFNELWVLLGFLSVHTTPTHPPTHTHTLVSWWMFVGLPFLGCYEGCGHDFRERVLEWTYTSKCLRWMTPRSKIAGPHRKLVSPEDFWCPKTQLTFGVST